MNYTDYLSENLERNINYSEYIAENLDKSITYTEYIAEHRDLAKEKRELREKKLKRILNEI